MNTFNDAGLDHLRQALARLGDGFKHLPDHRRDVDEQAVQDVLQEVAVRMRDNDPYHHPLYVGQMLKPPHPVAREAYALAMHLNPNNHALDGGRASSQMEKEAVAGLAEMVGWAEHLGHLTGGGTMANFEALWVGRELRPGEAVAASAQAHYTHRRLSAVLGVPFVEVASDARGRMDLEALEDALRAGEVSTVVASLGSTALGAVDPLPELRALCDRYDARLHVDAAYGGYFTLTDNLDEHARRAFDALHTADSVVIDPHKHGLQPYGCGCVLFRDPGVGRFYRHDSPYTYFSSDELHLGEISLECSRPGAAAVALWATMRLLPLERGGAFAEGLATCRRAALRLHEALSADDRFVPLMRPELDIAVWAVRAETASAASQQARALFREAARHDLHLALSTFPKPLAEAAAPVERWDEDEITCLRACTMKPEHEVWMPRILARFAASAEVVLSDQPTA